MLKRYQVLLEDWLGDHFKAISRKYDISFSEAVRILTCLQVPRLVNAAYPKYKFKNFDKELVRAIGEANRDRMNAERFHKLLSRIYFETHKILELWSKEEEKRSR